MKKTNSIIAFSFAIMFILTALVGSLLGCFMLVTNSVTGAEYSSAKAMCTMEATTGRVLYAKNENTPLPMASTTKIMTAITAIENCRDLDEKFEISPKSVGIPGTSIYLRKGEALSIRELLYGLMLVSGNDASVAIGERVGGNVKNFVEMMNRTASKIGAKNSHFDNTHGLDSKTHYTSAYDLALITSYALSNDTFREIVSTKNTKITTVEGKTRYLKNKNRLLNSLEGCNGVKTGFTDDAGRCLVASCERNGMQLVSVVLYCVPMFEECATLLEKGFNEYEMVDVTKDYDYTNYIRLEEARKEFVKVGTKGSYRYPMRKEEKGKITYIYKLPEKMEGGVEKDKVVGEIATYYGNDLLFSEKIYTMEEVRSNTILEKLKDIFRKW